MNLEKGNNYSLLALLLAIPGAATACAGEKAPPATTEPAKEPTVINMSYSNFFPPTHLHSILGEKLSQEMESRTDGLVAIDYYPRGMLIAAPQVYGGVVESISDIGMSVPSGSG